ncbi:protein EARLY FLOWERING 4 [Alnus glutinosa]|jgi:hypothetical protein|uniref:protein EARLY FLOWERING 4 n=1 Tax=Alnus glutinosa TaxID=3517 RepID=UPI002D770296|nr:protein EARLY FLOWERING 4 [Alnus glutinosa]
MSTPDSSLSTADSSMDPDNKTLPTAAGEECGDARMWEAFERNFRQVQSVLDQNRALIQQVNENHQSRVADNMVKNVALIQEINGNISKVVSLYSDLSSNFSSLFHQRSSAKTAKTQSPDP